MISKAAQVEGWCRRAGVYLEGGKVNDAVNGRVLGKDLVEGLFVSEVGVVESRAAATELLDAVEDDLEGVVQVVDNDDVVVVFEEGKGGKGADVAGSSVESRC